MLDSLTNLGGQFRIEVIPIILTLVLLEAILSADNAIALAALVRSLPDPKQEEWALRYGLIGAFVLRVLLILTATWVIKYWQFEFLGAVYLLWLAGKYFLASAKPHEEGKAVPVASKLWEVVLLVSFTDLAFSLDSVTAAVAVARETWLVLFGGLIGIITLRLLAGIFIKLLSEFANLEAAGYLIVALVGVRLLLKVVADAYVPPEWLMITCIAAVFTWGFSKRTKPELDVNLSDAVAIEQPVEDVITMHSDH
jgi:YkoY family integral membrane protein